MRDLQLCFLHDGGAELVDVDAPDDALPVWASDTDEDFAEEFPDILDENDVDHILDYLEEKEVMTNRELEVVDIIMEPIVDDPDDEDDDDEDDDDDEEDDDCNDWDRDDSDVIEGEVIDHG